MSTPDPLAWDLPLQQLVETAYDRHLEYMLSHATAWQEMLKPSPDWVPPKVTRREKVRRWTSRHWSDFRYRLAKRIYDFPEDAW